MLRIILLLIPVLSISQNARADDNLDYYKSRAVRVEVRGSTPTSVASSGFLWEQHDRVVTSLHAIPLDGKIIVRCGNQVLRARLEKMLVAEDLALLQVLDRSGNKKGLTGCDPFTRADLGPDPGYNSDNPLFAYGWHGDAVTGQPITLLRGDGGKLQHIVPSHVAEAIHKYGIPSISREIYAMRNGSLPGYSGAFIVDSNRKLIAIVDGGLNEGAAGSTWAIPSGYLKLFDEADTVTNRTARLAPPKWLYSTALAEPAPGSLIRYKEVDSLTDRVFEYQWVLTKTLSLPELAQTAADRQGLLTIFNAYGGNIDPFSLSYDIYEDLGYGLIIAVPRHQPLIREEVSNNPGFEWLKSESSSSASHTQYEQTLWSVSSPTFPRVQIHPDHPDYFRYKLSELLAACNLPGSSYCHVDPNTLRVVAYPNGNKVLRVGFGIRAVQHDGQDYYNQDYYDYYSIAVRDGVAFRAYLRLSGDTKVGPGPCADGSGRICPNPTAEQLSQMIAVQLTTFANFGTSVGRSLEKQLNYAGRTANPGTLGTGYFEDSKLRFYNSRGKIWMHYHRHENKIMEYVEFGRDENYAYLTDNGYDQSLADDAMLFAVPLAGGQYSQRMPHQQNWQAVGTVQRP